MMASTFRAFGLACCFVLVLTNHSTSVGVNAEGGTPVWAAPLFDHLSSISARADTVVAQDGTGAFRTVNDAIAAAPRNSIARHVIHIKQGVYDEIVRIPADLPNLTLLGDGMKATIITGARAFDQKNYSMPETATVGVDAPGLMLQDLTIRNTAGPTHTQAVALRSKSDHSVVYRCSLEGFQDTLYAEEAIQFYRDCTIAGSVDFIYGYATAVFQNCQVVVRVPFPGQQNIITAHGRPSPTLKTGFVFQSCSIRGDQGLNANAVKTYLGRPWKSYARVVFMNCVIDSIVDPLGYVPWNSSNLDLDTLYFAEFNNTGPGSVLSGRVRWPGFHVLDSTQARSYTVARFIDGKKWLAATGVMFRLGL